MAVFRVNPNSHCHARSNSLPSITHPPILQFEEHLCRLRSSGATNCSTSMVDKLKNLQDLCASANKLLLLQLIQQKLAKKQHEWIDKQLDGSLRFLDVCGMAREALFQTKECIHELQSTLRRRHGGESGLANEVKKYMTTRKMIRKTIHMALRNLKHVQNRYDFCPLNDEQDSLAIVRKMRELEALTAGVFESLLSFILGQKPESKPRVWLLVSKLMHQKGVEPKEVESYVNEFSKVAAALQLIIIPKTSSCNKLLVNTQNQLENLEMCIEDLEGGLEKLSRVLIKNRVSLLNILNH